MMSVPPDWYRPRPVFIAATALSLGLWSWGQPPAVCADPSSAPPQAGAEVDDPFAAAAAAAAAALASGNPPAGAAPKPDESAAVSLARPKDDDGDPIDEPTAAEVEDVIPEGSEVDGREIYDRLIKNRERLATVFQHGRIISEDPGGNPQQTNFWIHAKDYRDINDDAVGGIYSKSLFKITGPYEMRHTGYLYIERDDRDDEQFMYSPNRARTSRVSLKGQSVAGTDFSFDDFLVSLEDIEDATYKRHDDDVVQGVPVYVVEAFVKPESKTSYTRTLSYIEKEHYVALRTFHWNDVGVLSKKVVVPRDKINEFDGAWLPVESTVTDLLEETQSTMYVDKLVPNPEIDDEMFALSRLSYRP
jgi:hypothetical protein